MLVVGHKLATKKDIRFFDVDGVRGVPLATLENIASKRDPGHQILDHAGSHPRILPICLLHSPTIIQRSRSGPQTLISVIVGVVQMEAFEAVAQEIKAI